MLAVIDGAEEDTNVQCSIIIIVYTIILCEINCSYNYTSYDIECCKCRCYTINECTCVKNNGNNNITIILTTITMNMMVMHGRGDLRGRVTYIVNAYTNRICMINSNRL